MDIRDEDDAVEAAGWGALLRGRSPAALFAVCLGVWLHAADGLMVSTLVPDIVAHIGGARYIAWNLALYEIGSICAGAMSAILALRYGLRIAMSGAALLYLAGCALSALAPDMGVFLAGRLAQGFGGGGLVALSFVAISLLFDRALMPRVVAAVSALWGLSSFVGPLVGGLFAEWEMWRGAFWFFAAQAAALAAWIGLGPAFADAPAPEDRGGRAPLRRLGALALGVVAIAAAGIDASALWTPILLLAGFGLLGLFFRLDARAGEDRLLPREAMRWRTPAGAAFVMLFAVSAGTVAIGVYGPLVMIALHGVSALVAGYIVAVASIGWSATAILVAGSPERRDPMMILIGVAIVTLGVAGYAVAIPHGPLWLIALSALCEGGGFGIAWTFILRRLTTLSAADEKERVASAMPTIQRLGYAVGAALTGLAANAAGVSAHMDAARAFTAGQWIFASAIPLSLIGLAAAIVFTRASGGVQSAASR